MSATRSYDLIALINKPPGRIVNGYGYIGWGSGSGDIPYLRIIDRVITTQLGAIWVWIFLDVEEPESTILIIYWRIKVIPVPSAIATDMHVTHNITPTALIWHLVSASKSPPKLPLHYTSTKHCPMGHHHCVGFRAYRAGGMQRLD